MAAKENKTKNMEAPLLPAPVPEIAANQTETPGSQNITPPTALAAKSTGLSPRQKSPQRTIQKSASLKNESPNSTRRGTNNAEKTGTVLIKAERMSLQADRAMIKNYSISAQSLDKLPSADKNQGKGDSASKIDETLGLAAGGPLYAAAKEISGLKDDPLVKKFSGLLKVENTPSQREGDGEKKKVENTPSQREGDGEKKKADQTDRAMSSVIVKTDAAIINADKFTISADKTEFPDLDSQARKESAQVELKSGARAKKEVLSPDAAATADKKSRLGKVDPEKKPKSPDQDKSGSEQAQKEEKQKQESEALAQTIRNAILSKPAKPAPADKKSGKGGSKTGDALGLAVGGPLYSAAKELYALKNDPLAQRTASLFKTRKNKKQNKSEAENAETGHTDTKASVQAEKKEKRSPVKAEKSGVKKRSRKRARSKGRKDSRPVRAEKSDGRQRDDFDEKNTTSDVEADRKRDVKKRSRKRARSRGRRRRGPGRRGGLTRRLVKTKAGKGLSAGFNLVKSAGGKIGGLLSQSPLGAVGETAGNVGGKIGKVMGKANPLKLLGKAGGFLGRIAGKAALPLAMATTAFDMADGWSNASEITGKDEKELTVWDKIKASGAKAAEGLSFGLVPAETFFGEPEKNASAQKPVDVKKTSSAKPASAVASGLEGPKSAALTAATPAIATAKPGVPQSLPSPLSDKSPASAPGFKTKTPGFSTPPSSGAGFQEDKLADQKLDIIIRELRGLRKELKRPSSGGPSPVNDPFLRATIAETERQFNTW